MRIRSGADAEHWRAQEGYPAGLAIRPIWERLHHISSGFNLRFCGGGRERGQFVISKAEDYANIADLKTLARKYHAANDGQDGELDDARLAETIEVPWFKPPLNISGATLCAGGDAQPFTIADKTQRGLPELGGCLRGRILLKCCGRGSQGPRWD